MRLMTLQRVCEGRDSNLLYARLMLAAISLPPNLIQRLLQSQPIERR
jgi:hypothetical protein